MNLPLSNGLKTKIDREDYPLVRQVSWRYNKGYAEGKVGGKTTALHRFIKDLVVDHINHDTLDNRKANLRVVTVQENSFNHNLHSKKTLKTNLKGVHETPFGFVAQMKLDGRLFQLGTYSTSEEAHGVYLCPLAEEAAGRFGRNWSKE